MKLAFDAVVALYDKLVDSFLRGEMTLDEYNAEWDALLSFAGWTDEAYAAALSERWDPSQPLRRRVANDLFRC